jgi:hypothetical protein
LVTNPFQFKYLRRGTWVAGTWAAALACGGPKQKPDEPPKPRLVSALPTGALAGQQVLVLPLTLVAAEDSLGWERKLTDRRASLARADSIHGALLQARVPEVVWILPDALRRAAQRAPGIAVNPDQMATAVLRVDKLTVIPDPLRSQLRTLAAIATGGSERFALAPAALIYRRAHNPPNAPPAFANAELVMVLMDVRTGQIMWRTVALGTGDDPWTALTRAVKSYTPGLP